MLEYLIDKIFLCFRFDALTELGAFMRTAFSCISVLRVVSGPRVKLAGRKSAWRYIFGLARRGSTFGFHLLWHTVELAMCTRHCLL